MPTASRARRALVILTMASIGLLAASGVAQGAPSSKPYAVEISPLPLPAGGTLSRADGDPVRVTVTNRTGTQSIQSIEIEVPPNVTLNGAAPAGGYTPDISGGKARWLNQSVAPDSSETYVLDVSVPCTGTLGKWTVTPKQSNDFRGPPGNTFAPLVGDPDTVLTATLQGACTLTWTAPPADAGVMDRVSTVDFDPAGPAPAVSLLDGANGGISGRAVTISLGLSSGVGTLFETVGGTTDASGVAEFGNVKITSSGYYRLVAASAGLTAVTKDAFLVQTFDMPCESGCKGSTTGEKGSKLDVTVDPGDYPGGTLSLSVLAGTLGVAPDCRDYEEFSSEFAIVQGPGGSKSIRQFITKQDMNRLPNNGASSINVCYGDLAPPAFEATVGALAPGAVVEPDGWWFAAVTVAAGTVPQAWDFDGDGIPDGVIWVLANCKATSGVRPCEDSASKDRAGNGVVTYLAPSGVLDPYGRG
jgi:hypothetical protein